MPRVYSMVVGVVLLAVVGMMAGCGGGAGPHFPARLGLGFSRAASGPAMSCRLMARNIWGIWTMMVRRRWAMRLRYCAWWWA